jgi:ATP-dependent DNA ligase
MSQAGRRRRVLVDAERKLRGLNLPRPNRTFPRREPLEQRKIELRRLLADTEPGLVFNDWIDGDDFDGATVFEHACKLGVEGTVSKRKDSRYVSGQSPYWLKMMNSASEAVRREAEEDWGR